MKKYIFSLSLIFFVFVYSFPGSAVPDESIPPNLVIDYVSTIRGFIETCGCHAGNYGGIARRATYLAKLRKGFPNLLVLNGGDLNIDNSTQGQLKADFLFQAYQKMNYDAFNIGEGEFMYGWEYLQNKVKENPIFISANLVNPKTQKTIFPPYKMKTFTYTFDTVDSKNNPKQIKCKINVAIVGIISQSQAMAVQSSLKADSTLCTVADPVTTLNILIPDLRKYADLIVVLAHMPQIEIQNFIKQVPRIDILIAGHDGIQRAGTPQLVEHTITGTNGDRGRFGGTLELRFNKDKHIVNYRGTEVALSSEFADDTDMATLVGEYKKISTAMPVQVGTAIVGTSPHWVGSLSCRACHLKEYQIWEQSPHAHTFEGLKAKHQDKNNQCIICHTLAFAKEDGFVSEEKTPNFVGVQCESCHQAGSFHVDAPLAKKKFTIERTRGALTCVQCHDHQNDPKFNYPIALAKIKHWK